MKKIEDLFRAQAASPTETIGLFNGAVGFRVPEYQRPYDWARDNITRLFSDCLNGFHRLGTSGNADAFTFLGTLILVKDERQEASFGGVSVAIVDGQQRLTTLTLLACALVERMTLLSKKIDTLPFSEAARGWLKAEVEDWIRELTECAIGSQKLKGHKTYPFPRIVRAGDQRGKSAAEAEYRSALGKFLNSFGEYVNGDEGEFQPPSLGSGSEASKLGDNFSLIRELIKSLNDPEWYETAECEIVPIEWISRAGYRALFERLNDTLHSDSDQNSALSELIKTSAAQDLVRTLLFAAYFSRCIVLTRVITDDESAAFDIFDALNSTGEPLTAIETLKPRVIQYENGRGGYGGSASEEQFARLKRFVDEAYPETAAKQSETKALIVSFGLLIEGQKLAENLSAQRNFLRTRYDKAASVSRENAQRFVRQIADVAEVRHQYWTTHGIETLANFHDQSRLDEIQQLVAFLNATKSNLVLPIIARYWRPDLKQAGDEKFLQVIRAVTAFLVLRRAATGTTASIDSDFRAIMAPLGTNKFGLNAGVDKTNALMDISALRAAFRTLLAKSKAKIAEREKWISQTIDNPLYQQSKEIARFMLLIAADGAQPSTTELGCWNKIGVKSSANDVYLDYKTWRSPNYATVEHVAPDSEQHLDWDKDIYKNSIIRHTLGNLCLLPAKENGAIGNGSWAKKRLFYRALTETTEAGQQARFEEAAAQGMKFSNSTRQILKDAKRLPLLDPLVMVDEWTVATISARGRNIAGHVWDRLWPWLS
ncbi:DUF262 domain-containing protein [Ensifer sp. NPDC090286]|uniref:GmrSD restriction endonuclease domain-containing protein n=1 Tax=Ensifer sp. NPDC090286 TaxID=3363991 RepID=UPI003839DF43